IVWFVDFLFNPIEVQLRKAGTTREAILRFALVAALSLVAVVVLIFTYRLVTNSNPSLIGVLTDVLFAGHFNPDRKEIEGAVSEALAHGDLRAALAAVWNMELSLFVSLAVCVLFYLTIVKRAIPMLLGGGSVFNRTPEESAQAGMASLQ